MQNVSVFFSDYQQTETRRMCP